MAEAKSKCHCSVPQCKTNKQRQPYLTFHGFPGDRNERRKWFEAIRRDEGQNLTILRGSTFVCSLHFSEGDFIPTTGRKRLKNGAVPSRFHWNNWGSGHREPVTEKEAAPSGQDAPPPEPPREESRCEDISPPVTLTFGPDHDYAAAPTPGALDAASERIQQLEAKVQMLETERTQLKVGPLYFNKFCVSDEDVRFYTRFPSKEVFHSFWEAVQPSAAMLVYWSKAQEKGQIFTPASSTPSHSLPLIDEFFLYCCRVAAGLKEKVLADIFQISVSTVSSIVITWANYLYLLLSSAPIWMSKEQVRSTMPPKFRQDSPEVRVIIDCAEVRCHSVSSLAIQSDCPNTTTYKGLVGVAPCGAVTFVSGLYSGSISDQELTERCGILDLLEAGDGCVTDKGLTMERTHPDRGETVIITPVQTSAQLSKEDALKTQAVARLRTLVERAIQRVKEYHIWDETLPVSLSGTINQLWINCCLMSNFQGPL